MVKGDGKVIYQNTLDPASEQAKHVTLHANEKMQLQLGNAGGVEVTVNDKPYGALGKDNEVKEVTITPQGIQK